MERMATLSFITASPSLQSTSLFFFFHLSLFHQLFFCISRIFLADVVDTIKEYAFKVSPYPLILSIENHCSIVQQLKMVEILRDTLGEMLDVPPVTPDMEFLPSPEALKNKILIKGQKVWKISLFFWLLLYFKSNLCLLCFFLFFPSFQLTEAQIAQNDDQVSDDEEEEVQTVDMKIKTLKVLPRSPSSVVVSL